MRFPPSEKVYTCNILGFDVVVGKRDDSQNASCLLKIARIITETRFNASQFEDKISEISYRNISFYKSNNYLVKNKYLTVVI